MNIHTKILFPIAIVTSVLVVGAYCVLIHLRKSELDELLHGKITEKMLAIDSSTQATAQHCLSHAAVFSQNPAVRRAYRTAHQGDMSANQDPYTAEARELLRKELKPSVEGFSKWVGDDYRLHFHLPSGRSLLRVWRPDQDNCDDIASFRRTVVQINKYPDKPITGIEVGRAGFVIRGLVPIEDSSGQHLGSVEVLAPYLPLVNAVAWNEKEEIFLYMREDLLSIATGLCDSIAHPRIGNWVQVAATDKRLAEEILTDRMFESGRAGLHVEDSGHYRIATYPIFDYQHQEIGRIVISYDLAVRRAYLDAAQWIFGVGGVVVLLIMTLTGYRISLVMEKVMAEAQKAESLATIISEAPFAIQLIRQSDLRVIDVNEGASEALGYSRDELLSMTPLDYDREFSADQIRKLIEPLVTGRVDQLKFQTVHQRKSGDTFPVEVDVHTTTYQGELIYLCFITDLTDIKKLEQQVTHAEKMQSIGQLSAGIAHEINTPMQYVQDNVEYVGESVAQMCAVVSQYESLLRSQKPIPWHERRTEIDNAIADFHFDSIRTQVEEAIDECREGIQCTVDIIQAMRTFSHPGQKGREAVDLNHALQSVLTISRNRWKRSASVELELDDTMPQVPVFASEINQVLLNLVVNAADAIIERHGEYGNGKIRIRTRREGDMVMIEVEDNGSGIPDSIQRRIFDPFFTTKEIGKGTGQGLSIAYNVIVNLHGGTIRVKSEEQVGSVFTVRLPYELIEEDSYAKHHIDPLRVS
ncbi:ATP-binding protein [Aeoliella sp.]|uniref:ATP-binding protein n=1 Tax=Aeoliella sp. TaxID=2795800 RepID=UPI003CCBC616